MSAVKAERYPGYKDSGVEWLGDVPNHWGFARVKEIAYINQKTLSDATPLEYEFDYVDIGSVTYGTSGYLSERITFKNAPSRAKRIVKNGDAIISTVRTYLKAITQIGNVENLIVSTGFTVLTPKNGVNNTYFSNWLMSETFINRVSAISKGVSYPATNSTEIGDLFAFLPPLHEQTAIAVYLDTKTAQIDRQIDLLSQKVTQYGKLKQSLINETVTRGLDKSVPMKDSGVELIGAVPKHWKVKRFKEIFNKTHSGWTPDTGKRESFEGENIWVTIRDMDGGCHISSSVNKLSDKAVTNAGISITPKGSLLFSFKLSIGKIAFAGCDLYTNEAIISIESEPKLDLNYFFYTLPIFLVLNAKENIYGAKLLNQGIIFNTSLLYPPKEEQAAITAYLDEKTAQIDRVVSAINSKIEKLKDLRKALINDAVTGKIKVASEGLAV